MTDLCDLSALDQRRLIGSKEISPVELLDSCLERIAAVDPAVNALPTLCIDRARMEAQDAEDAVMRGVPLGPLHGLPLGVKDLNETAGVRTTFGSLLHEHYVPAHDDRMVADCRAAGAILVGKTNTPEFGAGANTVNKVFGATGNPFDPDRSCAGSSGGSAVALATGMVSLATGSDLGGSLRNPAAFCGIVGFRPSLGLVPDENKQHGWSSMSVDGPMARTVRDVALLLSVQAGYDSRDPLSRPFDAGSLMRLAPVDLSGLRVAVSADLGFAPVDDRIRATFAERIGQIAPVFAACDWRDPDMEGADAAFTVLRAQGYLAAHHAAFESDRDRLSPRVVDNVEQGLAHTALDVARAHQWRTRIHRAFQGFMDEVDVLITPAISVPPFPWRDPYVAEINGQKLDSYFHWLALAYGITLTGHPAICIPCGREPTGTPFHLQIVGRQWGDKRLLEIAAALADHLGRDPDTARPIPDLTYLEERARTAPMEGRAPAGAAS